MTNVVLTEDISNVRIITLNRPECLNALNNELIASFLSELRNANNDNSVKVIILRGAGKAFCAGEDLVDTLKTTQESTEDEKEKYAENLQNITREMFQSNKFIIGAIHGWAVGAGFEWTINCDFSIWTEGSKAFFPEMKWGMFPTGGVTYILPHIVGLIKARELLLFGEKQSASQLFDLGIAWKVVAENKLMDEALKAANVIASLPVFSVQGLKQTINKACFNHFEDALQMETKKVLASIENSGAPELLKSFNQ